jgi:tRNA U38,U39,U40 pseudouridine synthase TruA
MVRAIVGTLVEVGRGKLDPAQFGTILEAGDRRQAGPNAPPHGLILTGVDYPDYFEVTGRSHEEHQQVPGPGWLPGHGSGSRSSVSALT